jgi:Transglycosylase SLT domain
VVLVSGPLREPSSRSIDNRVEVVEPPVVAPNVVPGSEVASSLSQGDPAQSDSKFNALEEALPEPVKKGGRMSFRAPIQIADLMKCKNLGEVIKKYAQKYGVDEELVWAVIRQESGFNPGAVSPKGAMGLMQLMPGTAALMGVSDPFDVEQNIAGGVKYLEQCLNQFNHNVPLALAAYNAGPGNVVKYQGCPPFAETRNYVATILQAYAGESIRENLKLLRVNYVMGEDVTCEAYETSGRFSGLPWRVPLPNWKIAAPQDKLGTPRWKVTVRPF